MNFIECESDAVTLVTFINNDTDYSDFADKILISFSDSKKNNLEERAQEVLEKFPNFSYKIISYPKLENEKCFWMTSRSDISYNEMDINGEKVLLFFENLEIIRVKGSLVAFS